VIVDDDHLIALAVDDLAKRAQATKQEILTVAVRDDDGEPTGSFDERARQASAASVQEAEQVQEDDHSPRHSEQPQQNSFPHGAPPDVLNAGDAFWTRRCAEEIGDPE
jgi:hypothetical protein